MKLALYLGIAVILSFGCAPVTGQPGSNQKTLKVGVSTNAPPIIYKDNNKIHGLEADFARGLAEFTGRKIQFVQLKWEDQIPALLSGKTDIIMSGMTITDSRKYRISFTNPYIISGQISLIRLVDKSKFHRGAIDLLNPSLKIGTIKGTTGDLYIQQVRANGKRIQFDKSSQAAKALLENELDAFVYDLPGTLYLASLYADQGLSSVNVLLTKEQLAWGVRPGDKETLNSANNYLDSLAQKKALLPMIQKWIPAYK
jgi:ABC-type amino acid transport substrate-binding protein